MLCRFALSERQTPSKRSSEFFSVRHVVTNVVIDEKNRKIRHFERKLVRHDDNLLLAVVHAHLSLKIDRRFGEFVHKHAIKCHVVVGAKPCHFASRLVQSLAQPAIKRLKDVEVFYQHIVLVRDNVAKHNSALLVNF